MAKDVYTEITKSGVCRYYDIAVDARADQYGVAKSRRKFDYLFSYCQTSFNIAYFAYKYLTSKSSQIRFVGLPFKSNGGNYTYETEEQALPINFDNFKHQMGLPTFKTKTDDATEMDFAKELKAFISTLDITSTNQISPEDVQILMNLQQTIEDSKIKEFDLVIAKRMKTTIEQALQSNNIEVRRALYVTLKELEKNKQEEMSNFSFIHNVRQLDKITNRMKVNDLIKWIETLPVDQKAALFKGKLTSSKLDEDQKLVLSIVLAHMDKYSGEPYMKLLKQAKQEYLFLYAEKKVDRDIRMEMSKEAFPEEMKKQLTTFFQNPKKLDALFDSDEKISLEEINYIINNYDKYDSGNFKEVQELLQKCNAGLNTLKDCPEREQEKTEILEVIDIFKEEIIDKIEKSLQQGKLTDYTIAIYKEAKIDSEKNTFLNLIRNGVSHRQALSKYMDKCCKDDSGLKEIGKPTDKIKSLRDILATPKAPTSYIDYILMNLEKNIEKNIETGKTKDVSYEGTAFDKLSRIQAKVLKEIIKYDIQTQDINFSKERIISSKVKTSQSYEYDTIDICYLLLNDKEIEEEFERRYESKQEEPPLNLNFQKIQEKTQALCTIGSIKEKPVTFVLAVDDIEYAPGIPSRITALERLRERFADNFDPNNPQLDRNGRVVENERVIRRAARDLDLDTSDVRDSSGYILIFNSGNELSGIYLNCHYKDGKPFLSPTHLINGLEMKNGRVVINEKYKDFIVGGKVHTGVKDGDIKITSGVRTIANSI